MCGNHGAGRVLRYLTGPASDEWCTNTTFVEISLMPSEWTIAIEKYRVMSAFAMRSLSPQSLQRFFHQMKILYSSLMADVDNLCHHPGESSDRIFRFRVGVPPHLISELGKLCFKRFSVLIGGVHRGMGDGDR